MESMLWDKNVKNLSSIFLLCALASGFGVLAYENRDQCNHEAKINGGLEDVNESDFTMNQPPASPSSSSKCSARIETNQGKAFTPPTSDWILAESGLEFINQNSKIKLDKELLSKLEKPYCTRDKVLTFTQNIKGLFGTKIFEIKFGDGDSKRKKPDWCFKPELLKILAEAEIKIYDFIANVYKPARQRIAAIDSYLQDVEKSSLQAIKYVQQSNLETNSSTRDQYEYIATHPLLIYRMVRRFAEDLMSVLSHLKLDNEILQDLLLQVNPDMLTPPNEQDLHDAITAITRIQHDTNLKSFEMANGILYNVKTPVGLNALHALEIGVYYMEEEKLFDLAVEWFHLALETVSRIRDPNSRAHKLIIPFFENCLSTGINRHNDEWKHQKSNYWTPSVFNTVITTPFKPDEYVRMHNVLKPQAAALRDDVEWNWGVKLNFVSVCSGDNLQGEKEKASLKCWYIRHPEYYWLINPMKVELLNRDPPLIQIYEFIGNGLIEEIKEKAINVLERSTVVDRENPTLSVVDSTRTSSQAWLYDNLSDGDFLKGLTRNMELVTGLSISPPNACDAYQVASYGPSHHYAPHIDSFEDPRRCVVKGNRITTIMGYLTDVEAGGRTGFPAMGVSALPIKGSVVIWNNLMRNGENRDMRTWHGGCPVVLGNKWITNKWVYYKENFLKFPCGLDPHE